MSVHCLVSGQFLHNYEISSKFPLHPVPVALYATYLNMQGYAPSFIVSALSVISLVGKFKGHPEPIVSRLQEL
jgi:hypothetical protein